MLIAQIVGCAQQVSFETDDSVNILKLRLPNGREFEAVVAAHDYIAVLESLHDNDPQPKVAQTQSAQYSPPLKVPSTPRKASKFDADGYPIIDEFAQTPPPLIKGSVTAPYSGTVTLNLEEQGTSKLEE